MKKINIGILGCANIATRSIIPNILKLNNLFNLFGIASRNKEKADRAAQSFNTTSYLGYDNILKEEKLDAIYIPLPNALHFKWIQKAIDQGLHILVEKSLACKKDEVEFLNEKAQEKGLVLFENFQFRFHSQLKHIINLITTGTLGELRAVRSSFGFPPFQDENNIRYKESLGGGALLDAGAYPIKISQILLGNNLKVSASKLYVDEKKNVDIWGGAFLEQKNGSLFSEISFGFDNFYQCNLEVWGSKAKLFTNRIFTAPHNFSPELILESSNGKEVITLDADNHFINMLSYFHKLCTEKENIKDEYQQNVNQARLINELKEKADIE